MFDTFTLIVVSIVVLLALWSFIGGYIERRKDRRKREENPAVVGKAYRSPDDDRLEFTITEVDEKRGEVDCSVTVIVPHGATVINFDDMDSSEIHVSVRYEDGRGGESFVLDVDSAEVAGLEGWTINLNQGTKFRNLD